MPVVGTPDSYVEIAELRARPLLSDPSTFPDAALTAARSWFEQKFERYTGHAFVPRTATVTVKGSGCSTLRLPEINGVSPWPIRSVTSVTTYTAVSTSTTFTADEVAGIILDSPVVGYLDRWSGVFGTGWIVLEVIYGEESPDEVIRDAAFVAIADKLNRDLTLASRAGRVYALQTEVGVERRTRSGPGHPFGIDDVDEVAVTYRDRYRVPATA